MKATLSSTQYECSSCGAVMCPGSGVVVHWDTGRCENDGKTFTLPIVELVERIESVDGETLAGEVAKAAEETE